MALSGIRCEVKGVQIVSVVWHRGRVAWVLRARAHACVSASSKMFLLSESKWVDSDKMGIWGATIVYRSTESWVLVSRIEFFQSVREPDFWQRFWVVVQRPMDIHAVVTSTLQSWGEWLSDTSPLHNPKKPTPMGSSNFPTSLRIHEKFAKKCSKICENATPSYVV